MNPTVLLVAKPEDERARLAAWLEEADLRVIACPGPRSPDPCVGMRGRCPLAEGADVVVLDLSMPGLSGLDLIKHLRSAFPALPLLVLSMHPEEQYAVRVLRAGAAGYLSKDSAEKEVVRAIRHVAGGGRFVTGAAAEALLAHLDRDPDLPPHHALSDREFEVLRLLASGKPVSAIGDELALSVKTVSTYRARLLQKMGMKNNAELTRYAIEEGLV
jgi:two-component system, NarL family, invasion response regulator UvrY